MPTNQLPHNLAPQDAEIVSIDQIEAERRRMARLLQSGVIEPLNLLLAQTNAYEQTLGMHQPTRLALAVLGSLARQVLQQARDLEQSLRPIVLDELGLEPALDMLANQARRAHALQVGLVVERLRDRPPRPVELALFRLAQDAVERAIVHACATQISIRLDRQEERLILTLADDGGAGFGLDTLLGARRRIEQLGGSIATGIGPHGGLHLVAGIAVAPPPTLTPRELEVLRWLSEGLSNKAIAAALGVSPRTINFHLDNLYSKLGVASRTEAVLAALRRGWVRQPGEPG
jgi:DNA-binding CsgD family transcriptional regulator/glucose-6-phosphate-specific signal transduction histidine kinase